MNIKVKFYMMFNCGETQIRTLDDLRENFCIEDVLTHYEDGRLEKWLDVWRYRPELEAVRKLKASGKTNAQEILAELMRIFGAGMDEAEIDSALEIYDYIEERRQFGEYMRSNGIHELEEFRKKCTDLQNERDSLQKKYADLQIEQDSLQEKYAVLQNERDSLRKNCTDIQSERDSLRKNFYILKSDRDTLRQERDDLQSERDALIEQLGIIRQRFAQFKDRARLFFGAMSKAISYVFNRDKNVEEAKKLAELLSKIPL